MLKERTEQGWGIQEIPFVSTMKDRTRLGNTGNVLHEYDERQTRLGNTGNVLHEYDERQNQARKCWKCPS
jgi:hypothetical protein